VGVFGWLRVEVEIWILWLVFLLCFVMFCCFFLLLVFLWVKSSFGMISWFNGALALSQAGRATLRRDLVDCERSKPQQSGVWDIGFTR